MSSALINHKSMRQRCAMEGHGGALLSTIHDATAGVAGTRARPRRAQVMGIRQALGITLSPRLPSHIWGLNSVELGLFMMGWLSLIYTVKPQINTNRHFLQSALINISTSGRSMQETSKHL